jgi:hypothetical protein
MSVILVNANQASAVWLNVIKLSVFLVSVILVSVILVSVILVSVILVSVILVSVIQLSVILLNVIPLIIIFFSFILQKPNADFFKINYKIKNFFRLGFKKFSKSLIESLLEIIVRRAP